MIGKPDVIIDMPGSQEIPATGVLDYQYFSGKIPFSKDLWVVAAELQPGCRKAVHHAQLYTRGPAATEILSYSPGEPPVVLPPDTIVKIPCDQPLLWMMHYTPYGKAATDRSRLGLRLWKGERPPKYIRRFVDVQNMNIDIPPGASNVEASYKWVAPKDSTLLSLQPHMHLRGKDFTFEMKTPRDYFRHTYLWVPRYDFNWQTFYEFASPISVPAGTLFCFKSHYDNSRANPANPDPTRRVKQGPQTDDEMQSVILVFREDFNPADASNGIEGMALRGLQLASPTREPSIWLNPFLVGGAGLLIATVGLKVLRPARAAKAA
jgi:hypothetical protein